MYRKHLLHIIRKSREIYLHNKGVEYKQNGYKLWQLINRIIGKEPNKMNVIESLKVDFLARYDSVRPFR